MIRGNTQQVPTCLAELRTQYNAAKDVQSKFHSLRASDLGIRCRTYAEETILPESASANHAEASLLVGQEI